VNEPDRDSLAASLQRFGLERDRMRAALARQAGITATDLDALEHLGGWCRTGLGDAGRGRALALRRLEAAPGIEVVGGVRGGISPRRSGLARCGRLVGFDWPAIGALSWY